MLQKKVKFFKGPLRSGPLPVFLASFPSPCPFPLPIRPQRITCSFAVAAASFRLHASAVLLLLPPALPPPPSTQCSEIPLSCCTPFMASLLGTFPSFPPILETPSSSSSSTHVCLIQSVTIIHSLSVLTVGGESRHHDYLFCVPSV